MKKPQIKLQLLPPGTPYFGLHQQLKLSPPIANSVDDIAQYETQPNTPPVDGTILHFVSELTQRKPTTDKQMLDYILTQGHDATRRDIALARKQLGILSSTERYQQ